MPGGAPTDDEGTGAGEEHRWTMLDALLSASEHETAAMEACLLAQRDGGELDREQVDRYIERAITDLERAVEDLELARDVVGCEDVEHAPPESGTTVE